MKNGRLEIILHRNQKHVVVDLVLAIVFLFGLLTTAVAIKTGLDSLGGAPVASSPCAQLGDAHADPAVLAFAVSPAAGAPLPR